MNKQAFAAEVAAVIKNGRTVSISELSDFAKLKAWSGSVTLLERQKDHILLGIDINVERHEQCEEMLADLRQLFEVQDRA